MKNKIPDSADQLIIRKEAQQNAVYHYDRAARLALKRSQPKSSGNKRGFFRRISNSKMMLTTFIFIVLIIAGILFLYNRNSASGEIGGYKVQLHAFRVKETLYAFISFEKAVNDAPLTMGTARIVFRLKKSGQAVEQSLDWQEIAGTEVKISLPVTAEETEVEAQIRLGAAAVSLFKNIAH